MMDSLFFEGKYKKKPLKFKESDKKSTLNLKAYNSPPKLLRKLKSSTLHLK